MIHKKIHDIITRIIEKKKELDTFQPLPVDMIKSMWDWLRVELTYTSNAIEGNTLTRKETAIILEDGISPAGKKIVEILEAQNHNKALTFIIDLAKKRTTTTISQQDILNIHNIILTNIQTENAGTYRNQNVRISGSSTILPNYMKVPELMNDLEHWVQHYNENPLLLACDLHYKFVRIHPFVDGNGRTGRLLFNLVLLMSWYPLSFIATQERNKYLESLETLDKHWDATTYYQVMLQSVERSLDLYLDKLHGKIEQKPNNEKLLKIGQLAKRVWETVPTIRHRTSLWLLPVTFLWPKQYAHYDHRAIIRVEKIRELQKTKRYSLQEIKELLGL